MSIYRTKNEIPEKDALPFLKKNAQTTSTRIAIILFMSPVRIVHLTSSCRASADDIYRLFTLFSRTAQHLARTQDGTACNVVQAAKLTDTYTLTSRNT